MTAPIPTSSLGSDKAIWCGIPVYNNAATIVDVARRCRQQVANVVVVDDGSTDADLRELLKSLDVSVVRHPTNLGKGAALLTAFRYAAGCGGEYMITLDGDGQHFPEDIPHFLPHLSPDTIVVGYRHHVTGVMPRSSRFGRDFSDFWIYVETGRTVRDTQSGFRAYPLQPILDLKLNSRHYNFEMEIITRAMWAGLRTKTVLIGVWYPNADERVSSFRKVRDNLRISLLHARLVFRQLLPIPHLRIRIAGSAGALPTRSGNSFNSVLMENSTPIGLAVAAALSILLGVLLWPYGVLVVAYVTARLHLNKVVALAGLLLSMPPALAAFCGKLGHLVARNEAHPGFERFIGSHIVAFAMAAASAWAVYLLARHFQNLRRGDET